MSDEQHAPPGSQLEAETERLLNEMRALWRPLLEALHAATTGLEQALASPGGPGEEFAVREEYGELELALWHLEGVERQAGSYPTFEYEVAAQRLATLRARIDRIYSQPEKGE